MRFTRPALSASVGSLAGSARPMAFIMRLNIIPLAPTTNCPSPHVGVRGHDARQVAPVRSRTKPLMPNSGQHRLIIENTASYSATSTTAFCRRRDDDAAPSARPLRHTSPRANRRWRYQRAPARDRIAGDVTHPAHRFADGTKTRRDPCNGPVCPNPERRTMMSLGFTVESEA